MNRLEAAQPPTGALGARAAKEGSGAQAKRADARAGA